ncbi:MAG: two-component system, OmpR family, sensor kinase [Solirubrobacteraceae bacterium]|nr:two-component system, OmpR family, sensor kinase [Solirubrobacteraceae bacterium]
MESPVSYIRSAAQATSSAYKRLPIRWRLAGGSAVLTLVILLGFAAIVGVLTTRRIREDFNDQVRATTDDLAGRIIVRPGRNPQCLGPDLNVYGGAEGGRIRVLTLGGDVLCETKNAPDLGFPRPDRSLEVQGYRVESRLIRVPFLGRAVLQYGRKFSDVDRTVGKVRVFLILGVLAGAALALLAGLAVARRAMTPISGLTKAAREIERTRDPTLRIPHPEGANDEVAELARTLEGMLQALDAARSETEAMLARQRAFVADASHELRTPLTSVLANLELLDAQLAGEQGESAKAALRSAQRMRRLVGNLLLLARADAGRATPRAPTDMGAVLAEAAAELQPVSGDHELSIDTHEAFVEGARDELHRMTVNLMENAIRHTPDGTQVRASVSADDGLVTIAVEDDGPGVPDELAPRIFERFVRGGGERAGSSGLGLAIVRAVAEGHGGSVALERSPNGSGARFVVRLPAARAEQPAFSPA